MKPVRIPFASLPHISRISASQQFWESFQQIRGFRRFERFRVKFLEDSKFIPPTTSPFWVMVRQTSLSIYMLSGLVLGEVLSYGMDW